MLSTRSVFQTKGGSTRCGERHQRGLGKLARSAGSTAWFDAVALGGCRQNGRRDPVREPGPAERSQILLMRLGTGGSPPRAEALALGIAAGERELVGLRGAERIRDGLACHTLGEELGADRALRGAAPHQRV